MTEELDEEIRAVFLEEAAENLEKSHEAVSLLLQSQDKVALLNNLARFIHTIKGGCGMFDMLEAQKHAHELEDYLKAFKDSGEPVTGEVVDKIKLSLDHLDDLLKPALDAPAVEAQASTACGAAKVTGEEVSSSDIGDSNDFLRVPMRLVNDALNNIWEIFLIRNQVTYFMGKAGSEDYDVKDFLQDWELLDSSLRRNITELEGKVMAMRMTNLKGLYARMGKVIRNYSSQHTDKKINLETVGAEVEVDKKVSDMLSEPFIHLIRNAIDHGIESIEDRLSAGKSPTGTVRISAESSADRIKLIIQDDGKGIDHEKIAQKAFEKGLIESLDIDKKSALNLIFKSGFSTAKEVTDVSGRGVGMDSVKSSIESFGGDVSLETEVGHGSKFIISFPLSLSVVSAIIFEDKGKVLGANTSNVAEILYCNASDIKSHGANSFFKFRSAYIPCISLANVLGGAGAPLVENAGDEDREVPLIVLNEENGYIAIRVEKILDNREIIVKPSPSLLPVDEAVDGMSILPTGQPIFIVSLSRLLANSSREEGVVTHDAA